MNVCKVEACDRFASRRGWCDMHYARWRRNGDPTVLRRGNTECGTSAGYWQHITKDTTVCDPCREARNTQKREWTHSKGIHRPRPTVIHGTIACYAAGCRNQACKDAHAEYMREWRKGNTRSRQRRTEKAFKLVDRATDFLELDGGWLTADGLAADLDCNPESVGRILRQLRDDGVVESRTVELAGHYGESRLEWRHV